MWRYKYNSVSEFSTDFQSSIPVWWEGGRVESFRINATDVNSEEYIVLYAYNPGSRIKNLARYSFSLIRFCDVWFSKEVPGINLYISESPGNRSTGTWDMLATSTRESYVATANNLIENNFFKINWPEDNPVNNAVFRYHGISTDSFLDVLFIKENFVAMQNVSFEGTYSFSSGGYKYLSWPDSWGSPIPITGFRDTINGMPIAMASENESPEFNNEENGWHFARIILQDSLDQNISYRLYRTRNILGGALSITIN